MSNISSSIYQFPSNVDKLQKLAKRYIIDTSTIKLKRLKQ